MGFMCKVCYISRNLSYAKTERINDENFVSKPEKLLLLAIISNLWQMDVIFESKLQ